MKIDAADAISVHLKLDASLSLNFNLRQSLQTNICIITIYYTPATEPNIKSLQTSDNEHPNEYSVRHAWRLILSYTNQLLFNLIGQ